MLQMMERISVAEVMWRDTTSVFARPEHLRLQMQMRSCKLKCELADDVSVGDALTMLQTLQQAAQKTQERDESAPA